LPKGIVGRLRHLPFTCELAGAVFAEGRRGFKIQEQRDLAVECVFERLAEVQEAILWLCEAAHVPVIWATQVLESLAKDGQPSRAEITDAAMSHRAECVMLNKGPYVMEAVHVLDDILHRMHGHQAKKRAMLRELDLVSGFRRARLVKSTDTPQPASLAE
jgi:Pyruvate kinase, barrel domain